jgi:hypothetical protein
MVTRGWPGGRIKEDDRMVFNLRRSISKDLVFTAMNQIWRILSGPVTLVLIPLFLTPEIQGYWFTIVSFSFLMIFADLGFSNIILQFAAHEFAYLKFDKDWKIYGEEEHLKKLASFFVFSLKWMVFVIILAMPVISAISFFILTRKTTDIHWFIPWLIYLIASIFVFYNNIFLYFFEGCDLVWVSQRIRLFISIVLTFTMWGGLMLGLDLYALSVSLLVSALVNSIVIYNTFKRTIGQFMEISRTYRYSWGRSFFPLLRRYAISFTSGYFIFQIYTPLMFYYHGPIEAGKVGISIALWMAVYFISTVWITAVTPKINMHISRKERDILDRMFLRRILLSALTFLAGAGAFFVVFLLLKGKLSILNRFADETSMFFLAAAWFLQTIVNSLAVYLRGHKEEPLVLPSLLSAVYITFTTVLCAKYLPSYLFFLGFLSCYIWSFPWILMIFMNKKRKMAIADK